MMFGRAVEQPIGRCILCKQYVWASSQDYQGDAIPGQEPTLRHLICTQVWEEEATLPTP